MYFPSAILSASISSSMNARRLSPNPLSAPGDEFTFSYSHPVVRRGGSPKAGRGGLSLSIAFDCFSLLTANCSLLIDGISASCFSLLIDNCSLLIADWSLLIDNWSLPIALLILSILSQLYGIPVLRSITDMISCTLHC